MANPTVSLVAYAPAKANGPGHVVVDATWATYAQNADVLDLTGIAGQLPGFEPSQVQSVSGAVNTTGHSITGVVSSPTMASIATLRAWAGTTQVTAGTWANTARLKLTLQKANFS